MTEQEIIITESKIFRILKEIDSLQVKANELNKEKNLLLQKLEPNVDITG